MIEYIVEVSDLEEFYYKYSDFKPKTVFGHRLRGEIVRCRDCIRFANYEPGSEIGTCDLGLEDTGLYSIVEPNGFCAWGERTES